MAIIQNDMKRIVWNIPIYIVASHSQQTQINSRKFANFSVILKCFVAYVGLHCRNKETRPYTVSFSNAFACKQRKKQTYERNLVIFDGIISLQTSFYAPNSQTINSQPEKYRNSEATTNTTPAKTLKYSMFEEVIIFLQTKQKKIAKRISSTRLLLLLRPPHFRHSIVGNARVMVQYFFGSFVFFGSCFFFFIFFFIRLAVSSAVYFSTSYHFDWVLKSGSIRIYTYGRALWICVCVCWALEHIRLFLLFFCLSANFVIFMYNKRHYVLGSAQKTVRILFMIEGWTRSQ